MRVPEGQVDLSTGLRPWHEFNTVTRKWAVLTFKYFPHFFGRVQSPLALFLLTSSVHDTACIHNAALLAELQWTGHPQLSASRASECIEPQRVASNEGFSH